MAKRSESATVQLKVRLKEPLRAALKEEAEAHGRSLNAEVVHRLEETFQRERTGEEIREAARAEVRDSFGGARNFKIMRYLGAMIAVVEQLTGKPWDKDAETAGQVADLLGHFFKRFGAEDAATTLMHPVPSLPESVLEKLFRELRDEDAGGQPEKTEEPPLGTPQER